MQFKDLADKCWKKYQEQGDDHKEGREFDVLSDVIMNCISELDDTQLKDIVVTMVSSGGYVEVITEVMEYVPGTETVNNLYKEAIHSSIYEALGQKI